MSTLKVDGIRSNSASSDAITLASDGTCSANISSVNGGSINTNNLVDNGAMLIKQRSAASVNTTASILIDRFGMNFAGADEGITLSQSDVASGTTPYSLGLRKALKVTNGNQTSGAGSSDFVGINHVIESQNIATSGWNYNSTSSYLSVSFWVKSSVAQKYYMRLFNGDGTVKVWVIDTGVLTANTWTKVTDKIPGHADLQFDFDNGAGLNIQIIPYYGTDFTDNSVPVGSWTASIGASQVPDMTTTWWTTNDSTFEITGFQIEVGPTVSAFALESYADTLRKCQRYFYVLADQAGDSTQSPVANLVGYTTSYLYGVVDLPVEMKSAPSIISSSGTNYFVLYGGGGTTGIYAPQCYAARQSTSTVELQVVTATTNVNADAPYFIRTNNASTYVYFTSEF